MGSDLVGAGCGVTPPEPLTSAGRISRGSTAIARFARRTFESLSVDQARSVLETRPDAVASVRRSGPGPYRILCFGGGPLQGLGIRDHNLGLPGRVADQLVEQTGRGVQIDVIVNTTPTAPAALALLAGLRLRRYDAVIVFVGDSAIVPRSADQWRGAMVGLTKLLLTETSRAAGVFVYDSTRAVAAAGVAGGSARSAASASRLTEVTESVCALTDRVRFHELRLTYGAQDASGRFSDGTYRDWADLVVTRMRPTFAALSAAKDEDSPRTYRNRPHNEALRQRALDALRLRGRARDAILDREVASARSMYRTSGAALTILDGDVQWAKASTEAELSVIARQDGFCGIAIGTDELTLINDTWADPRTRAHPLSQGEDPVRFYAGFPIHSIDGYRIGMVCVYGSTPRTLRPRELEGLRDVAARVEQHLWNELLHGRVD